MELLGQQFLRLGRQNARKGGHLLLDLRCVERQPVQRNQGGQGGEQRELLELAGVENR
jgi:hypothetical protein